MSDLETLDERLRAVERALTGEDRDLTDLRTGAELAAETDALADRLDEAENRLDELDAATQALRGYVGNARTVNETVERRADAALAKAEALEREPPTVERPVCDCEPRRAGECADSERPDPDRSGDDAGLLARLAEALG
ncbi:DUF7310 family coiled-coil domain-containing protein [Halorussus marinus]|uniref:DUF7310 family coiled-coil domain-containing protein n=1 Tax=Halorussus marinus TaxID=2505976 RepID=UPI00106E3391|nr:hypothetical protein [Halorussus marinus]